MMIQTTEPQIFTVPGNETVETAREFFRMSPLCRENLNTENFGVRGQTVDSPIEGRFLIMDDKKDYLLVEAEEAIRQFSEQEGKQFRFGDPLELLVWKKEGLALPPNFISLGKTWYNLALTQTFLPKGPPLDLKDCYQNGIPPKYRIFIVRNL